MSLSIQISQKELGRWTIVLTGRLDTETYAACEEKLAPLIKATAPVLVFDMTNLSYISSMGLRVILKTRKAVESAGGQMLLTHLQPQIAKVFDIAKALPTAAIFTSIKEADQYLDAMQRKELEKQQ